MRKKFLASIIGLFVAASSILALNGFISSSQAVTIDNSADCDTVAIIKCGAFSESELRTDAAKGDVPKVFSAFNINQSQLSGFSNGVVWKDGRVTVGDKVVATGAMTAGRWNNPTSDMTSIPGTTRAYKMSTSHFVTDGQTAFVKMVNGKFSFAVIKTCGNPVSAKPTTPTTPKPAPPTTPKPPTDKTPAPPTTTAKPSCTSMTATLTNEENRTYKFAIEFEADGATFRSADVDFGDGDEITGFMEDDLTNITHSYSSSGTFTAVATLHFKSDQQAKSVTCQAAVTTPAAPTQPPTTTPEPEPETPTTPTPEPETTPEPEQTEIPSTGATELVAGGLGIGSLTGAGYYWYASRRKFIDQLLHR